MLRPRLKPAAQRLLASLHLGGGHAYQAMAPSGPPARPSYLGGATTAMGTAVRLLTQLH